LKKNVGTTFYMTEKLITTRYIIEISICQILKERKKAFGFKSLEI